MPPPAATQAAARLWTAHPELHTDPLATKLAECMTPPAGSVRRFTRGRVSKLKNGHNSVTVQNRTHVYMNFFHHKDLGNHLLQLCPKVVKHPIYIYIYMWQTFVTSGYFPQCGNGSLVQILASVCLPLTVDKCDTSQGNHECVCAYQAPPHHCVPMICLHLPSREVTLCMDYHITQPMYKL